jgi:hypothetical protein
MGLSGRVALSSHFGLQNTPWVTRNALNMGEVCSDKRLSEKAKARAPAI